jgi:hypothetical protein
MVQVARSQIAARPSRAACILSLLSILPLLALFLWARPSFAADPAPVPAAAASQASKSEIRPTWSELTPAQRDVLGPLASQWSQFDSNHKTKWLAISAKYQTMAPEKQQRLKQNIADWAKLTPEQHRLARESYAKAKKLNAEQKTAQWEQYQQLPEEQKQKLAADAAAKKRIANVPSLQTKTKTVEPLRQPKKPPTQVANTPGAASAPTAPVAPPPAGGMMPVTNPQPATPVATPAPVSK